MRHQIDKAAIALTVVGSPSLSLRSITEEDLDILREWKNKNRRFFFHKEHITAQQQRDWFAAFQRRPLDLIFAVTWEGEAFGCMGIRFVAHSWDVYNVILGRPAFGGRGLMSSAFRRMLTYACSVEQAAISLKVLKHNPAVNWYQKQGFVHTLHCADHYLMTFRPMNGLEAQE